MTTKLLTLIEALRLAGQRHVPRGLELALSTDAKLHNIQVNAATSALLTELSKRQTETDQLLKEILKVMKADGLHRGTEGRKALWQRISKFRRELLDER